MALFKRKTKEEDKPAVKTDKKPPEEQVEIPAGPSLPKGGDAHSYKIVSAPHITEKGTIISEHNQYVFRIAGSANKTEVKKAVENLYKVEVAKVHVLYAQSKSRRVGRHEGRKAGFKKAIVTLKEGSKIDIAG